MKINKALYEFSTEEDITRTLIESKTKKQNNTFNIYIFIENSSQNTIRFNKNFKVGIVQLVDEVKLPDNTEELLGKSLYTSNTEVISLIQASPEIIKLRDKEFKEAKINPKHLTKQEQRKLHNVSQNNFKTFSSSLKSLGHTHIIEHTTN